MELVDRAVQARKNGSTLDAGEIILAVSALSDSPVPGDLLSKKSVQSSLNALVPRLLASTPIERRIAVFHAFTGTKTNALEVSSFMHRVRRSLDLSGHFRIQPDITEAEVAEAVKTYVASVTETLPPSFRGNLETRYATPTAEPLSQGRSSVKDDSLNSRFKPKLAVRIASAVLLILIASAIGTWIAKPSPPPMQEEGRQDILSLMDGATMDGATMDADLAFRGSDAAQVESSIKDRTGISVRIPAVAGGSLMGVSFQELAPSLVLPILHYKLESNDIAVFVLDYSIIQLAETQYSFDRQVLNEIAQPRGLAIGDVGELSRLTFRNRDDVFVTYSDGNPQSMRNLFSFDS